MLPYILIGVAVVIALLVILIAIQPAAFRIERSILVNAPPATVFEQVNDFRAWAAWSPWDKIDPNLQRTYSGPPSGPGTAYAWIGNSKVGQGNMTLTDSTPPERLRLRLEFLKPFKATNTAEFTFKPQVDQTLVNWAMAGRRNFAMKAFGLLMNFDKLVGGDFEKGLVALKAVAESQASR